MMWPRPPHLPCAGPDRSGAPASAPARTPTRAKLAVAYRRQPDHLRGWWVPARNPARGAGSAATARGSAWCRGPIRGASRPPAGRSPIRRLGTPTRGSPPHERSRREPGGSPQTSARPTRPPRSATTALRAADLLPPEPPRTTRLPCSQPFSTGTNTYTPSTSGGLSARTPSPRSTPPDDARTCRCEARICSASASP